MPGQQPWQDGDGRGYATGPAKAAGKNAADTESRATSFREWINTTTGVVTAVVAVLGLLAGGTVVTVKVLGSGSTSSSSGPGPTTPPTPTAPVPTSTGQPSPNPQGSLTSAQLASALLPVNTLGSAAVPMGPVGTSVSQISPICGGTEQNDLATAYEAIKNQQDGTVLDETLVSWTNAAAAGQAIANDRQGVDQNGSCSYSANGNTYTFSGDYPGAAPSDCNNPGQFFATNAAISSQSGSFSPFSGYSVEVQCGSSTIAVLVVSDLPGAITQQAAYGDLTNAISRLDSAA